MYVIYDCNSEVVGKYATHRGALIAVGKCKHKIWDRFYNRKDKDNNEVYSIIFELSENDKRN